MTISTNVSVHRTFMYFSVRSVSNAHPIRILASNTVSRGARHSEEKKQIFRPRQWWFSTLTGSGKWKFYQRTTPSCLKSIVIMMRWNKTRKLASKTAVNLEILSDEMIARNLGCGWFVPKDSLLQENLCEIASPICHWWWRQHSIGVSVDSWDENPAKVVEFCSESTMPTGNGWLEATKLWLLVENAVRAPYRHTT